MNITCLWQVWLVSVVVWTMGTVVGAEISNGVTVALTDDSVVVGSIRSGNMMLRTDIGQVTVPVELAASLAMEGTGALAVVEFLNTDRLSGALLMDVLTIDTVFGSVGIPVKTVRRVFFSRFAGIGDRDICYTFNDRGEVVSDSSGKGHVGQFVRGKVATDSFGEKVAVFDGTAYIVVGGTSISFESDFSIAAWLCPEKVSSEEWEPMIASRWTQQPNRGVRFSIRGPRDAGNVGKLCLIDDSGHIVGLGGTPLCHGEWHHVAVVYRKEGQNVTFFVDGKNDGRSSNRGTFSDADTALVIGSASWQMGQNGFVGLMDDVVIVSRAMDGTEVRVLAQERGGRVRMLGVK